MDPYEIPLTQHWPSRY